MNTALPTLLASHSEHWEHGWWPIWPLLWIGLIVAAIWFFGRRRWSPARPEDGADRARGILAERYARGEISSEEYRERLEQLR
ncbi:MAG: SHOCT domain-containing protein [Gaiellaceae bacterium]